MVSIEKKVSIEFKFQVLHVCSDRAGRMIVSISMELSNKLILPSSSAEEQIAVLMIKIDLFQIGRMCDNCDRKVKQFFSISIIDRVGKEQIQKRILLFIFVAYIVDNE